jgi:AraC-like DNA-binding protein
LSETRASDFVEWRSDFVERRFRFRRMRGTSHHMQAETWGTLGSRRNPAQSRLLRVLEAACATLRHAFYDAGARVEWHEHETATLVYGVGGPCVECDAEGRECVKRRFSYHPPGYAHSLTYQAPTHVLAIELNPEVSTLLPLQSRRLPATLYDRLWELFVAISRSGTDRRAYEILETLVADVVAYLERDLSPRVSAVMESLHAEWDRPLEPSQTARHFGVSPQLIRREFKRALGITLSDYRRLIQLDYARGLLWGTRSRISDVAAQTAFSDQSHLCRVLKEHTRLSPLELRQIAPCLAKQLRALEINPID